MIILQVPTSQNPFFDNHYDFLLFLVLTIFGLYITYRSFEEAKSAKIEAIAAKNAARETGRGLKIKESSIDISKVIDKCSLEPKTNFAEASNLINDLVRKINYILNIHRKEIEECQPGLIQQINSNLFSITNALARVNPSTVDSINEDANEDNVYNTISPNLTDLIGSLSILQAILDEQLFKN